MPAPRGDKWETDIERRLAQLEQRASRPLSNTGLSCPAPNVTQIDGDLVLQDGSERSGNYVPGSAGFNLDGPTGNVEVNDITLRGGIIGNDALTNPVVPGSVWESAANFTVSPTWATIIDKDVTIPAGFTSAVVSANARVTAFMNQDSPDNVDYLYAVLFINGNSSDYYPLAVTDIGGSGTNHVFRAVVLSGLTPGGTINLQVQASTGFETWTSPSAPGNKARLGASIQWFR